MLDLKEIDHFSTVSFTPAVARRLAIACAVAAIADEDEMPPSYRLPEDALPETGTALSRKWSILAAAQFNRVAASLL